jgi:glycosyltransferase involved in cell wall biosynthesis
VNDSRRRLVTLVLPAFNEEGILRDNVRELLRYVRERAAHYDWEFVIVNDGSRDRTGEIADELAREDPNVHVVHHVTNFGLGQAFRSGFAASRGDYVITLDMDLSYSPEHIGELLEKISSTHAKMVLASPYMKGGRLSSVPWLRRVMSVWANRFLSFVSSGRISTLTCMTRAYDGDFIRALNLRSMGMDVMPETIYKAMVMRGRIEQIPAHLDWSRQVAQGVKRRSSMRIVRHMLATVLQGFVLRPFMFFILPGLVLLAFALWTNTWMFVHFFDAYASVPPEVADRVGAAIGRAYREYPHTFIVGLLSLMLAVQLLSLGVLALQSKTYFEELFHLGSAIKRELGRRERDR